ncbi:T9SS type A sorting domain-containing protein [Salibacter halophilus]|uniref:T9SS type A sorting domain-containing protein n=1 Tax=Salibacter halophilus TaxID=1803916 RepID=A0A6N6M716_9FLAO|nr:T9SS type A sorting domain-containing protein [Salibacter halophilus]KAB1065598.1 T9SS type A sorting domain-containing protein [Salibacter halophilus]
MKHLLPTLLFVLLTTQSYSQTQIGNDIDGEAVNDNSGESVSMPDANTLAIGAIYNDDNGVNSGHVRVYTWNGNSWNQKGNDIDGEANYDRSGKSVSMPDSNTLAIGAHWNNGTAPTSGHVRVYTWNGNNWNQKGNDIDGEAFFDRSGVSVSMPDKNTVAIGATTNDGNGTDAGHVRIYIWNGTNWIQKGNDIDGEAAGDLSGNSVSMPDSNTVAIGAYNNDGNGTHSGHVRIYSWNGTTWVQKGIDIDGEAADDESGHAVSMPDSNTVAIGAPKNDGTASNAGHVRIYSWNGNSWIQKGNDIDGEAFYDHSGWSVSMSDSNTLVIGAKFNSGNGSLSGHVRIYYWNANSWMQVGNDIDGETAHDRSGFSVSMPDNNTVSIGARLNNGNGAYAGHVRVYSLQSTYNTISPVVCNSFTSPSGNHTWTTSGTYYDTLLNAAGLDSIITVNLTINQNSFASISPVACNSFTSPSGNYTWTTSGTHMDTIPNATGCDSIITVNLTVNQNSFATISPVVCDSYISPSGNHTWYSSGTYMDTIFNSTGCDSIITINLTVNNSSSASISPVVCDSYTSPSGNYTWTTSGTYIDTIPNSVGCDSIITVNLTVQSNGSTQNIVVCDTNSYTWPVNLQTYPLSGTYTTTLSNVAGCDSIITLNLEINNSTTANISPVVCNNYNSPSENHTWTTSGTYMDTISNTAGCDSIITINLTVNNSNAGSQSEIACDSYTWPASNQTYTSSGNYTTTLTNSNGCDSVVTLNLTVNNSTSASIFPIVCSSFTSPSGNYTWTSSGTYQDTISNSVGCDSIITVNLTVNNNTGSQTETVCNSYTWPANNQTYNSSGNYTTTLTNSNGCDSVATLNLTVNDSTSASISPVVCNNYNSPSGNYTWTTSGTYMDTIPNTLGCDSIITVNLTVNNNTGSQNETVCNSYTWPANNQTYTSSGNYSTTLTNSAGCDSIVTLNLSINDSSSSTISPDVCDNYTSPSGNYNWTTSGTYQDTISNNTGCDSVITIDLNVDSINTVVQNSGDSLIAQDTGATYQWVYCDNNSTPIPGETGQILEVAVSGDYAVSLTKHGCIDTSACYNVIPSGFETAISGENNIIVYPNPNEGLFTIEHSFTENKPFEVTNINGKVLYRGTLTQKQTKVDLSNLATGIYLLRVEGAVVKLVLK